MGCCGCDNQTSVLVAAIFSIIQSGISLILCSVNINNFSDDKETVAQVFDSNAGTIKGVLSVGLIVQLAWLLSSILLIYGNTKQNVRLIRSWLVVTSVAIVCQVLLPIILLASTVGSLDRGFVKQTISYSGSFVSMITTRSDFIPNVLNKYISLVCTFSEGGLITLIINIVFCVYTGRRVSEILNPQSAGYVIGPSAGGIIIPPQNQMVYPVGQLQYPTQQPQPYFQGQAVGSYPPPPSYQSQGQSQMYPPYPYSQPPSYQGPSLPSAPGPDSVPPPYPTSETKGG